MYGDIMFKKEIVSLEKEKNADLILHQVPLSSLFG
jgi:hypothetical protein